MTPSNSIWANSVLRRITLLTLGVVSASQVWFIPAEASAPSSKTYQLKANQGVFLPVEGPSLKRDDMNNARDPFDNKNQKQEDEFDAPPSAFQVQSDKPSAPRKEFKMNATDTGEFSGQPFPGISDQVPQQQAPRQQMEVPNLAPPTQVNNARQNLSDPDAQEARLGWDAWHQRVAEAIFNQISGTARILIPRSEPLMCVVNYTVTRDGRVVNVHFQQNSSHIGYNTMVLATVSGMSGNPVLQFPQGSRRQTVDKLSTFKHNASDMNGYQYIKGDQETLRMQNHR